MGRSVLLFVLPALACGSVVPQSTSQSADIECCDLQMARFASPVRTFAKLEVGQSQLDSLPRRAVATLGSWKFFISCTASYVSSCGLEPGQFKYKGVPPSSIPQLIMRTEQFMAVHI